MVFGYFKRRRRQKLLLQRVPRDWDDWLRADLPIFGCLTTTEQSGLIDIARVLLAEKEWVGVGGFELTERKKLCIAAQAALLLLHIKHDYYRFVKVVRVTPSTYEIQQRGAVVDQVAVLGHTSREGYVTVSWDAVKGGARNPNDGHNVVFHEFSHQLDFLDEYADGTPPLSDRKEFKQWVEVMTEHYEQLVGRVKDGKPSVLRAYGAQDPCEFFAVATESFFEKPRTLKRTLPDLYDALRSYYNQDPAAWR